jgi:hypothetical protein
MATPSTSQAGRTINVAVATSLMLTFISFWRAAIVLHDLGSSTLYRGTPEAGYRRAEASEELAYAPVPQRAKKRDGYEKRMGIRRCNACREVSSARTKVLSASSTS